MECVMEEESWSTKTDEEKQLVLAETQELNNDITNDVMDRVKTDDEKLNNKEESIGTPDKDNDDGGQSESVVDQEYTPPHSTSSSWSSAEDSNATTVDAAKRDSGVQQTRDFGAETPVNGEDDINLASRKESIASPNAMADTEKPPTPEPATTTTVTGDTEPDKRDIETVKDEDNKAEPTSTDSENTQEKKDNIEPETIVLKDTNEETEGNNVEPIKSDSKDLSEDATDAVKTETNTDEIQKEPDSAKLQNDDEKKDEATNQDVVKTELTDNDEGKDDKQNEEKEQATTDNKEVVLKKEEGTDDVKEGAEKHVEPIRAGSPLATEQLRKKVKQSADMQEKLDSALGNQQTEKQAYQKLTEENARLQKHHDDMEAKYNEMTSRHVTMEAELESLGRRTEDQKDTILRLEKEIKILKETQGGEETIKDLREKLIRLSKEQEEKDKKISGLDKELKSAREKLQDSQSNSNRHTDEPPKSKSCILM